MASLHAAGGTRHGYRVFTSPAHWIAIGERAGGIDIISAVDQAAARGAISPQEAMSTLVHDIDLELQRRKTLRYDD